jgi:phosphocarrier protein FPr
VQPAAVGRRESAAGELRGLPGNPGAVVGAAYVYLPTDIVPELRPLEPAETRGERVRFEAALASAADAFAQQAAETTDATQREVLSALRELTSDSALVDSVCERIAAGEDAASATHAVGLGLAEHFARADTDYFRARAEDMRDVTRHLVEILLGVQREDLSRIDAPCVVVAGSLSAVEFARLPKQHVLGIMLLEGGPTSHVAIMARGYGIPLVMSVDVDRELLRCVRHVALDGTAGLVILDPDDATRARYETAMRAAAEARAMLRETLDTPPRTRAGQVIELAANIGSVAEARIAREHGAMGVGLFRTEFLFMHARRLPTEDDQYRAYREVLEVMAPHPVLIRTLDIGGDKPLPGLQAEPEENPFLGWRGIRMCLDRPELFKPQLRALLRAAAHGRLRVMFPMISDIEEFRAARAVLDACRAELEAEAVETGPIELGIMVETPAAAVCAELFAREVAFFSIGTNDLTQYTMAADRAHRRLVHLGRADHPAVLRMIEMTCRAAVSHGIWVGVCGEAAGDPALIPQFLDWGITELSMSAPVIPRARQIVMSH